jgi:hypothetical protein
VYFLTGSPCGGKTTMCKALAEKYGFAFFNSNHREAGFASWQDLCEEAHQPVSSGRTTDWEAFFNRSTEEYLDWLGAVGAEYSQYAVIELIKLAQTRIVVTDIDLPVSLLKQIAPPERIACMLTSPDLVVRDYYQREDHRDIYDCILSLPDPKRALENNQMMLRRVCERAAEQANQADWFCVFRDERSTIDASLARLEAHFGLIPI